MERYKRCQIRLNKEKTKRLIQFKYGSLQAYCMANKIKRMRLWEILNRPHRSINEECLQKLTRNLEVNIEDILI